MLVDKKKLRIVGLTGGIGSGKSTVAELFRNLHVKVIDADQITRDLVGPGQPPLKAIEDHFGKEFLNKDGSLNRQKLKSCIFSSSQDRIWLENLLHPLAKKEILALKDQLPAGEYLVVEIPLLVETQFDAALDRVLVIDCPEAEQKARIVKRDGLAESSIEAILEAQATRQARLLVADDVILNTGSKEELETKVFNLHKIYSSLAKL